MKGAKEAEIVRAYLATEFGCEVKVDGTGIDFRFRIESDTGHFIIVALEHLVDSGAAAVLEMIERKGLIDELKNSDSTQRRAIRQDGIHVLDEN